MNKNRTVRATETVLLFGTFDAERDKFRFWIFDFGFWKYGLDQILSIIPKALDPAISCPCLLISNS